MNPLDILQKHQSEIDLPAFDILFERFIKCEWGKSRPRSPLQISKKITEFMGQVRDMKVTLTKE
jgi:hypothetical protein